MSAKICSNYKDVCEFYHYKGSSPKHPKSYPCLMVEEYNDGGLMGAHYSYSYYYAPIEYSKDLQLAYLKGIYSVKKHPAD